MFEDILKEEGKWSQGRIYLLLSVIAYFSTLGIITFFGMKGKNELDIHFFEIIIDALKYAMLLFGGYVFGGKFVSTATLLIGNKLNKKK